MLERRVRKQIENAFYNYMSLKTKGAEYLVELAESGLTSQITGTGGHSNNISNPTQNKALRLLDGDSNVLWCKVVEKTLAHFEGTGKDTLIRLKYFDKLSEWRLCDRLYIDRSVVYDWVKDILIYATMHSIQEKLIIII